MLEVLVATPLKVLFRGRASRVICPGEQGTFEIGPFHRPLFSFLQPGDLKVEKRLFPIRRGVVKVEGNNLLCIVTPL